MKHKNSFENNLLEIFVAHLRYFNLHIYFAFRTLLISNSAGPKCQQSMQRNNILSARRLIESRIIESEAYCNHKLVVIFRLYREHAD